MPFCLQVYDALNAMGSTAWSINSVLLGRVEHAYRVLKGGFCGLPLHETLDVAPVPPPLPKSFRTDTQNGQLTAHVSCHLVQESEVLCKLCLDAKKKNSEESMANVTRPGWLSVLSLCETCNMG